VTDSRSLRRSWLVGAIWGLGHTSALLVAGLVVTLVGAQIPPELARGFEFAVGVMLVVLGVRVLWRLARGGRLHLHRHQHGPFSHPHPHVHAGRVAHAPAEHNRAAHHHAQGVRSYVVGVVHGLGGSAALLLIALGNGNASGPWTALLYVLVFGVGSIAGMLLMSSILSLPFALSAARLPRLNRLVQAGAGAASLALGAVVAWQAGLAGALPN
ncbi:MAG: sulfite exporter TauE/SafE family protein, partial [Actinobacteria bacterium]|nr:sulfite exporter TauE/SafE family protein [Actinomycetota bacterium]